MAHDKSLLSIVSIERNGLKVEVLPFTGNPLLPAAIAIESSKIIEGGVGGTMVGLTLGEAALLGTALINFVKSYGELVTEVGFDGSRHPIGEAK